MKQKGYVTLVCLILACLFGCWLWSAFHTQSNKLCSEASLLFVKAIEKEKILGIKRRFGNYDSKSSPNEISRTEKEEWSDQDFLFYKDSTRTLLDSLFRVILLEHKIQGNTALRCIWENRVIETSSNKAFYEEAFPLEQIVYRRDESSNGMIRLQPFVKFSLGTVWRYNYLVWKILALGLLLIGTVIAVYRFWYKKMRKMAEQKLQRKQQLQELLEKEKHLPVFIPLTQSKTIYWMKLGEDLFFDEMHGDLCYKNNVSIRLTENSLRLFLLFIQVEEHKLTFEKICVEVLARSVKYGLSKTDRDAVSSSIRHLRKHLEQIPAVQIEAIRGVGYQMIFNL